MVTIFTFVIVSRHLVFFLKNRFRIYRKPRINIVGKVTKRKENYY